MNRTGHKKKEPRFCQFQVLDRPGNRWTMYLLDSDGKLWLLTQDGVLQRMQFKRQEPPTL